MNITPFPTLSTATIDAINVIGQWLAQDDFSGEVPYQDDCVILAGNAVMPTIDAACKIARDQQIPLLISGGIGHSTTFLYSAIAHRYHRTASALQHYPHHWQSRSDQHAGYRSSVLAHSA